jgi:hypothetical protein
MISGVQCVPQAMDAGSDGMTKKMMYAMAVAHKNRKNAQIKRRMRK